MVHRGFNLALSVGLLWASIPHALCACDHTPAAPAKAVQTCPHCPAVPPTRSREVPTPCDCGACQVLPNVQPTPPTTVPPPAIGHDHVVFNAVAVLASIAVGGEVGWAEGPPGAVLSGPAILIFLGRLLI